MIKYNVRYTTNTPTDTHTRAVQADSIEHAERKFWQSMDSNPFAPINVSIVSVSKTGSAKPSKRALMQASEKMQTAYTDYMDNTGGSEAVYFWRLFRSAQLAYTSLLAA